jgi:hypothetical protein
MTGGEVAQIILASATFVTAAGAVLIGLLNTRRIAAVHDLTNSKMDKLLEVTRDAAEARGLKQGQDERK